MVNFLKYKVIFIAEIHARNDKPDEIIGIRNIEKIYKDIVVPYQPDVILHELIDPRLQFTHDEFAQAVAKQQRLSHYGKTGTEMFIDIPAILDTKADVIGFDDPKEVLHVTDLSLDATLKSNVRREDFMLTVIKQFYRQHKKIVVNVGQDHVIYDTCLRRFLNSRADVCVVLPDGTIHDKLETDVITGGRFDINTGTSYKDKLREKDLFKKLSKEELDISLESVIKKFKEATGKSKEALKELWEADYEKFSDKLSKSIGTVGKSMFGDALDKLGELAVVPAVALVRLAKAGMGAIGGRNKKEFPDTHTINIKIDESQVLEPQILITEVFDMIKRYVTDPEEGGDKTLELTMRDVTASTKRFADLTEEQLAYYSNKINRIKEKEVEAIHVCKEELLHAKKEVNEDTYLLAILTEPYGIHIASGEENYLLNKDAISSMYSYDAFEDAPYDIRNVYEDAAEEVMEAYNQLVRAVLAKAKKIKVSKESYDLTTIANSLQHTSQELKPTVSTEASDLFTALTTEPISNTIFQKDFVELGTVKEPAYQGKYVKIEKGNIVIHPCFIAKNTWHSLLGGDPKIKVFCTKAPGFFKRTLTVPSFFKFELIALLAEAKKNKYAGNVKELSKAYKELISIPVEQLKLSIDRDHIAKTFNFEILDHQDGAIEKYLENKQVLGYRGMLLHAGVGTGKTAMSLFIMEGLHKEVDKVIIICPLPTLDKVWIDTLTRSGAFKQPQSIYNVRDKQPYNGEKYILCHYEGLSLLQELLPKLKKDKVGVIVDEVHNLTVAKSNRTQLALDVVEKVNTDNVILLSGTPIKSSIHEVIVILKFLDRSLDKEQLEKRFKILYTSPTGFMAELLQKRYSTYTAIISKDVIKLNPVEIINLKVTLPEDERKQYTLENIKREMVTYIETRYKEIEKDKDKIEKEYVDLREEAFNNKDNPSDPKARNDYINAVQIIRNTKPGNLFNIQEKVVFANQFEKMYIMPYLSKDKRDKFKDLKSLYKYPILKIQGEALGNIVSGSRIACHVSLAQHINYVNIQESTKKKVIYFSSYIEVCKAAEESLKAAGYVPVGIYGDTTKDLSSLVSKFTTEPKVDALVTTYQSLSTGTPLIAANVVVCIDMPFRMHTYEQAVGRAWRLGQDSNVTVYIIEVDSEEPTINTRNIDIITYFKQEVERITGVSYSTKLDIGTEELGMEHSNKEQDIKTIEVSKEDIDITPYVDQLKDNVDISTEASKGKRKVVEDLILKYIDRIVTGKTNTELYKQLFASMSDKQFDEFMHKLRNKEITLSIIVPNGDSKYKVDVENNFKLGKELGYDFFQKLHVSADENLPDYTTINKYMVLKLPVRRAAQLLQKKISIPEDNKTISVLTGQVAGDDKASKLSNPEVQVLLSLGLDKSIEELMKIRGGDQGARQAMDKLLVNNGIATQEQANRLATGVVSKNTLKCYFLAMHIANTL